MDLDPAMELVLKKKGSVVDNENRSGIPVPRTNSRSAMGRKMNVALLLTMHLTFIACAVLIVSPLMTEGSNQVDQRMADTITADEFEPFMQASIYSKGQKNMVGLQRRTTDHQKRFGQRLKYQWERASEGTQE